MRCLFVGGIADGTYLTVEDGRKEMVVAAYPPRSLQDLDRQINATVTIKHHLYTKRLWRTEQDAWEIMALSTMTDGQVFETLLRNYRPVTEGKLP